MNESLNKVILIHAPLSKLANEEMRIWARGSKNSSGQQSARTSFMSNSVSGNPEQECDTVLLECEFDDIIVTPEDDWMDDPFFNPESLDEEDDNGGFYPPQPEDTECHVAYGCGGGVGDGNNGDDDDELQKWEDEKIIDDELVPCMQTIVEDLKGVEEGVGEIIQKFAGETPGYNWELKSGSLGGSNAQTSQQYNSSTGTVTTTFDPQRFTNATDLSLARTILHEAVHAYIIAFSRVEPMQLNKTFSELMLDLIKMEYNNSNDAQHAEFVRNYVADIGYALQQYGQNKGYSISSTFYQKLAWGGLTHWFKRDDNGEIIKDANGNSEYEETPWFKAEFLTIEERDSVNDIILTEQGLININNQKGSDAGC